MQGKKTWTCLFLLVLIIGLMPQEIAANQKNTYKPKRHKIKMDGKTREYYVLKPKDFSPQKKYWILLVVHGGGGNGRSFFMTEPLRKEADRKQLEVIIVTPSFSNSDFLASRFPNLGEGEFLKLILRDIAGKLNVHKKILLTGYSRGGQFTHRFALQNPEYVKACAPFAAGTWTCPEGHLLIDNFGRVDNPKEFLSSENIDPAIPERLHNLFQPRVAAVAGLKAKAESKKVPFLVMCGTMDTRYEIAKDFARSMEQNGYKISTSWPGTPHGEKEKYKTEFLKYSLKAIEFFKKETDNTGR